MDIGVLPNKIQGGEAINHFGSKPQLPVIRTRAGNHITTDENRVIVGNYDDDRLNVNNNLGDNRNNNIGLSVSRQSSLLSQDALLSGEYFVSYRSLVDLIQPPSILPVSSIISWSVIYFLVSITLTSFVRRRKTLKKLSLRLVFSRTGSFSDLESWLALRMPSNTSSIRFSHLCQ